MNNQTEYEFSKEQIKAVTAFVMQDEEAIRALKRISEDIGLLVSAVARGVANEIRAKGDEINVHT